ncbi:MAG: glycosyltransferase family 39 protein, partial [Chitinophagaceae bacterium]|nr:glycosyltransferase family 39 protein [Chitinophagaceae bacterium]
MLAKNLARVVYLSIGLLLVLLSSSFLFFRLISYEQLIQTVLAETGRPDLQQVVTQHYFTVKKFNFLSGLTPWISACSLIVCVACIKLKGRILHRLELFSLLILNHIRNFATLLFCNADRVNLLLGLSFCIVLFRSIYYANIYYIQHDEAWNYNFFLSKNILNSLFVYNNYPLHNIVSWIFARLFSVSTFVLRVPSIAAGLLCCATVFVIVKKISGHEWIALCTMILFACLPVSVFYMLYARGVMFEVFFALLSSYLLYSYLQQRASIAQIALLAILNALGVCSMLSHVYFILFSTFAVTIFILLQNKKQWHFIILYPLLSFAFSFILLSPMIAGTGLAPGMSAATADANYLVLHLLPLHCYADFYTGIWFGIYPLLALHIYFIFLPVKIQFRFLHLLNIALLSAPFVIKGITGAWLPERALAFIVIVPVLSAALLFYEYKSKISRILAFAITASLYLSIHVHLHDKLHWSEDKDRQAFEMYTVMRQQQLKSIYNQSPEFIYFIPAVQ